MGEYMVLVLQIRKWYYCRNSGNSYITGNFQGTVDFGGGDVTSAGNMDIFVLKLNSSGTFQWVNTYGSTSDDWGWDIAVDSLANIQDIL